MNMNHLYLTLCEASMCLQVLTCRHSSSHPIGNVGFIDRPIWFCGRSRIWFYGPI